MFSLVVLSIVLAVAQSSSIEQCTGEAYGKVGCFKKNQVLFHEIMITDLDPTHHKWGKDIDWANFKDSMHSLACRCAAKAKGKYNYFAIGFYGECWAGSDNKAIEKVVSKEGSHTSDQCVGGNDMMTCDKTSKHECVGREDVEYVYQLVQAQPPTVPTDPCNLPLIIGRCRAAFPRVYFDSKTKQCKNFRYGGCGGNSNNFKSIADCQAKCGSPPVIRIKETGARCNNKVKCTGSTCGCHKGYCWSKCAFGWCYTNGGVGFSQNYKYKKCSKHEECCREWSCGGPCSL